MKNNVLTDDARVINAVIDALIISTEAQLRGLRRIRGLQQSAKPRKRVGMSQLDFVEDILVQANEPLHVNEIIARVEKAHKVELDRESIVSALTKRVARNDRFVRTDKNTFGIKRGKR